MKKQIGRLILVTLITLVLFVLTLFAFLTITEFKPAAKENEKISTQSGETYQMLKKGSSLKTLTWNTGYGALGDNADFFMDGGKSVNTATQARVQENMQSIIDTLKSERADILFLQEVDQDSSRSHHINERQDIAEAMDGYQSSFATNFKVAYIPYPWPPIGKVDSGILTLNRFRQSQSTRISLPCPFRWPVRMGNLKRCLLVNRVPIQNSKKELVLINLHLEAFDDGSGKVAQTKKLLKIMKEEQKKGNYIIAGGDFNQTFSSVDTSMYKGTKEWNCGRIDVKEFGKGWQFLMDNSTPTCRAMNKVYQGADAKNFSYFMPDGFIVSDNVKVTSVKTVDKHFKNTDHNPVTLTVTLQ